MNIPQENIANYLLAGKAIFTLYSSKLDKRYTYKIVQSRHKKTCYSAYVLYGQDNIEDYICIGYFYSDNPQPFALQGLDRSTNKKAFAMLYYFLGFIRDNHPLPESCGFYPSNRCARCGRILTHPESITTGIGPKCMEALK